MAQQITLSDGRVIERSMLGRLGNGTIVDFSGLKTGGKIKTLRDDGTWASVGDIDGPAPGMDFEPLDDAQLRDLIRRGVVKPQSRAA